MSRVKALNWCRATDVDPFEGVFAPPNPVPEGERRRPYPDADVEKLVAEAQGQDLVLVLLCAHGGLRINEAIHLQWKDVDLSNRKMRVLFAKSRKVRTVTLSDRLVAALQEIRPTTNQGPVILTAEGRAYADPTVPRRHLRQLCARAGIEYLAFHSLRHSAGTRLHRQTKDLELVAAHLGHSSIAGAAIYAKWSEDELRSALEQW